MSRKPKPKNTLSAGQRVALQKELEKKQGLQVNSSDTTVKSENVSEQPAAARSEVKKHRAEYVTVRVDLASKGRSHSALHGMCGGPLSECADASDLFRKIKVPCVRLADGAVQISRIFRNFSADERDEESYTFRESDKYVLSAVNSGAKIILRLGESADSPMYESFKGLLADPDKLCRICVNIIKHYNDYFAGGFALGIKYIELLGLPEGAGSEEKNSIFEAYARVADALKLYNERLMVGGVGFCEFGANVREFLRFCQKKKARLDFLSVKIYSGDVRTMATELEKYIGLLKNSEYFGAEVIVDELAYTPDSMSVALSKAPENAESRREFFEKQRSVFGTSFICASLLKMHEYPEITHVCIRSGEAGSLWCSLCDAYGLPEKLCFALEGYERLVAQDGSLFCRVEEDPEYLPSGIYASASVGEDEAYILMSVHNGCRGIDLRLDNIPDDLYNADVCMLDGVKNLDSPYTLELSGMRKRLMLNVSPYSVIFVKLY